LVYESDLGNGFVFSDFLSEVGGNEGELVESGLEIFDDSGGKDGWVGEVVGVFEAFVSQPGDVEAEFVALEEVFVSETVEAFGLFPFKAVAEDGEGFAAFFTWCCVSGVCMQKYTSGCLGLFACVVIENHGN
jgi:hypothetical protein